jgi:hypothetical protein
MHDKRNWESYPNNFIVKLPFVLLRLWLRKKRMRHFYGCTLREIIQANKILPVQKTLGLRNSCSKSGLICIACNCTV